MNFSQDIEAVIFNPKLLKKHDILSTFKVNNKVSILELIDILEANKKSIIINLKHLEKNYQRKGLKRVDGKRDEEGNLIKPALKTVTIDSGEYVPMGKFNINRNTATINMLIKRKVKLVTQDKGKQISEVAGILINDLNQYNNYTLVSDGEININSLKIKISNENTFNLLKEKELLTIEKNSPNEFDFTKEYEINFTDLPLVSFQQSYNNLEGIFEQIIKLQVLNSLISAHIKEESDSYSEKQLTELKKHYLSKNLYLNFPTTNEYTDLKEALNNGSVDTRISYKIDLGDTQILNTSKLYSANKFLDRLYQGCEEETGEIIENITFDMILDKKIIFTHKTLSKRTKITEVDELMKTIYDNFLGIDNNGSVSEILNSIKAHSLLKLLEKKWQDETINKDEFITALTQAKNKLNNHLENLYRQQICPLVFYIGSTGLIPDELNIKAFTAEEISANYPNLKLSKSEQEGTFFVAKNTVITVYPHNVYYTTNKR